MVPSLPGACHSNSFGLCGINGGRLALSTSCFASLGIDSYGTGHGFTFQMSPIAFPQAFVVTVSSSGTSLNNPRLEVEGFGASNFAPFCSQTLALIRLVVVSKTTEGYL